MHRTHSIRTLWCLRILLLAGLLTVYPLSKMLPSSHGWENGLFENAQIAVLLAAGVLACRWAQSGQDSRSRWFWCMVAPIWFILLLRELSWGATLLDPIFFSFETGPQYPSSRQTPFRGWVVGTAAAGLLFSVLIFLLTRQWRTLAQLWQNHTFPVLELVLAALATTLVMTGENRLPLGQMLLLSHSQGQLMEEVAEFWTYLSLAVAQWHIHISNPGTSTT